MAWLSLLLFLPWFVILGTLFWCYPRGPRSVRRRLIDVSTLVVCLVLSVLAMHWGYRVGSAQLDAGPIWPQVLAVLYAYGAFLAVMSAGLLLRRRGAPSA